MNCFLESDESGRAGLFGGPGSSMNGNKQVVAYIPGTTVVMADKFIGRSITFSAPKF